MTTWWHDERLEAVTAALRAAGARSVLDLGCGEGALLLRLAQDPAIERLVGIDISAPALASLRARLPAGQDGRIRLVHGSATDAGAELAGFDAATLVEVIEHLEPSALPALERAVFARLAPAHVIVTTPNAEFNALLGVPEHRMRHPGHRFEWDRARFAAWARAVASRQGYAVAVTCIAGAHPTLGGATQMAVFGPMPAP